MSTILCERLGEIPPGTMLADCAVSGGTLRSYVETLMALSGGKLCVEIRMELMEFTLPCRDGEPISPERLEALKGRYPVHFSTALSMAYLTYLEGGALHGVLFDTAESLKRKFQTARDLGVPWVLAEDPYVYGLLHP